MIRFKLYIFGRNSTGAMLCPSQYILSGGAWCLPAPILLNANCDHSGEGVSARLLHCKVTAFFITNKCHVRETLWDYVNFCLSLNADVSSSSIISLLFSLYSIRVFTNISQTHIFGQDHPGDTQPPHRLSQSHLKLNTALPVQDPVSHPPPHKPALPPLFPGDTVHGTTLLPAIDQPRLLASFQAPPSPLYFMHRQPTCLMSLTFPLFCATALAQAIVVSGLESCHSPLAVLPAQVLPSYNPFSSTMAECKSWGVHLIGKRRAGGWVLLRPPQWLSIVLRCQLTSSLWRGPPPFSNCPSHVDVSSFPVVVALSPWAFMPEIWIQLRCHITHCGRYSLYPWAWFRCHVQVLPWYLELAPTLLWDFSCFEMDYVYSDAFHLGGEFLWARKHVLSIPCWETSTNSLSGSKTHAP